MFVDQVTVFVRGGDGGRGCVSFRREAHVPRGGPDGGTGGGGGDVVLLGVSHQNTLLPLRYTSELRAARGRHGGPSNRSGRRGPDLIVPVPPGTEVRDESSDELIGEVLGCGRATGRGKGGPRRARQPGVSLEPQPRSARGRTGRARRGASAAPRLALDRRRGPARHAERGQVHAALAAVTSAAQDRRLSVHDAASVLGVVAVDDQSFVMADIPGIIEGAHTGAGLGLQFLRHVQRTRLLVYLIDASGLSGRDPVEDLRVLRDELASSAPDLLERGRVLAATKRDAVAQDDPLPRLVAAAAAHGLETLPISAVSGEGLPALKARLLELARQDALTPLPESA
jgi:GTP-binding protein